MNKTFVSIVSVAAILAFLMVIQATRETRALVLTPSELLQAVQKGGASTAEVSRVRVGGRVSTQEISFQTEPVMELRFSVEDPSIRRDAGGEHVAVAPTHSGALVPVIYKGLKPDMFSSGRDVLIDGEFKSGVLIAHKLLTQCPSKYEPPSPEQRQHQ